MQPDYPEIAANASLLWLYRAVIRGAGHDNRKLSRLFRVAVNRQSGRLCDWSRSLHVPRALSGFAGSSPVFYRPL